MTGVRRRRFTALAATGLALVLVALAAVVGVRWWQDRDRSDLERALAYSPDGSERYAWTDWAAVRSAVDSDVDATSSPLEVTEFLNEAYDLDLTSTTAMGESAEVLQDKYGLSPASVSWELLAQSTTGSVMTLGVSDDVDLDAFAETLGALGYQEPTDEDGVWVGGAEVAANVAAGVTISPQLSHLAIDRERHLVLASDDDGYLATALEAVDDERGGEAVADVASAVGDPVSALLLDDQQVCAGLAMSQADDVDQEVADELVAEAGDLNPLRSFAMAAQSDRDVVVAMGFENEDQARTNADTRARLASGPAPGQGGEFGERFTLGDVVADGSVVTMDLQPVEGAFVLSDLSSGPVLFATC